MPLIRLVATSFEVISKHSSSHSIVLYYTTTHKLKALLNIDIIEAIYRLPLPLSNSMSASPSSYNPYNQVSYVELNKRRRGEPPRDPDDRIENRIKRPAIKKIYLKRNGEVRSKRNGFRITHEDSIRELDTYYVTSDETLVIPEAEQEYSDHRSTGRIRGTKNNSRVPRHTSMSAPEYSTQSRHSLYDGGELMGPLVTSNLLDYLLGGMQWRSMTYSPLYFPNRRSILKYSPNPRKNLTKRKNKSLNYDDVVSSDIKEFEKFYIEAISSTDRPIKKQEERSSRKALPLVKSGKQQSKNAKPTNTGQEIHNATQSRVTSDFDHENAFQRDRQVLAKHKEKISSMTRSNSAVIYNRRDQTYPDAYIIYVFLNGQGLECQHINFQKKQLEKGMHYVLELIARKFNVNPLKLCNMDGKKITSTADLMSRGAYVLVAAGQRFRESWYFLPDNAIDTGSNRENSEQNPQRDQRIKQKNKKQIAKESLLKSSENRSEGPHQKHHETVAPGMKFGI
uniref:Doublecortin domain-containing protein n=1 Tax=Heterorhabditis bacteriophora TaxID=37862 RepID=A0A1I7X6E1_HETBA